MFLKAKLGMAGIVPPTLGLSAMAVFGLIPYPSFLSTLICNNITAPENVNMSLTDDTNIGSEARFFCFDGFLLFGASSATCLGTGSWSVSPPQCLDVDECFLNLCDHTCANYDGSYECHCNTGYVLHSDRRQCTIEIGGGGGAGEGEGREGEGDETEITTEVIKAILHTTVSHAEGDGIEITTESIEDIPQTTVSQGFNKETLLASTDLLFHCEFDGTEVSNCGLTYQQPDCPGAYIEETAMTTEPPPFCLSSASESCAAMPTQSTADYNQSCHAYLGVTSSYDVTTVPPVQCPTLRDDIQQFCSVNSTGCMQQMALEMATNEPEVASSTEDVYNADYCKLDCSELPEGRYQSCYHCNQYLQCGSELQPPILCPPNTYWDDLQKTCNSTSTTCGPGIGTQCVQLSFISGQIIGSDDSEVCVLLQFNLHNSSIKLNISTQALGENTVLSLDPCGTESSMGVVATANIRASDSDQIITTLEAPTNSAGNTNVDVTMTSMFVLKGDCASHNIDFHDGACIEN